MGHPWAWKQPPWQCDTMQRKIFLCCFPWIDRIRHRRQKQHGWGVWDGAQRHVKATLHGLEKQRNLLAFSPAVFSVKNRNFWTGLKLLKLSSPHLVTTGIIQKPQLESINSCNVVTETFLWESKRCPVFRCLWTLLLPTASTSDRGCGQGPGKFGRLTPLISYSLWYWTRISTLDIKHWTPHTSDKIHHHWSKGAWTESQCPSVALVLDTTNQAQLVPQLFVPEWVHSPFHLGRPDVAIRKNSDKLQAFSQAFGLTQLGSSGPFFLVFSWKMLDRWKFLWTRGLTLSEGGSFPLRFYVTGWFT